MPEELRAQVAFQLGTVLQSNALADYHFDLSQPDGIGFQKYRTGSHGVVDTC